ncbi:MAG: FkbM family methyltransferase [Bacteroidia bacterium]|nr:FkbM family methyltransferase [Bacteroidia bacterium]
MIEKKIRSILLQLLGAESYLGLVSQTYIRLISNGFLKSKYPELFYLKELIKPGFVCIDIGANVGYYSVFLSKYAGNSGHVYSVEPVPLFARVFMKNAGTFAQKNITLYQLALGAEEKEITLETPVMDGVFRHGLTKVVEGQSQSAGISYPAKMVVADKLFANLKKLDFLKCDVEGYEVHLFPQMKETIMRFKPTIQIEISEAENKRKMLELLGTWNYAPYRLKEGKLQALNIQEALSYDKGDYYFIPN